jgi:hypothetical protein
VLPDARTGRRVVTTPIVMGKANGDPERIIRGDPARRPLAVETFRDLVRQVLSEASRQ